MRIDDAIAGTYLVRVTSWNVIKPPQDFAVVVTGALASGLVQAPPGTI